MSEAQTTIRKEYGTGENPLPEAPAPSVRG